MCDIATLESREKCIRWIEGCQNHAVVERVIETADRIGKPSEAEIGEVEPGLMLYGFSELSNETNRNDKGRFQRRVFFRRIVAKPAAPASDTEGDPFRSNRTAPEKEHNGVDKSVQDALWKGILRNA